MTKAIGVDGTKNGWVISSFDLNNENLEIFFIDKLSKIKVSKKDLILIDIPLGLASKAESFRECDVLARKLLKKRAVTLFSPPLIEAFKKNEYQDALVINRKYCDKGFSIQAWNLKPKMLEARNFAKNRINTFESHPELCFLALNFGEALLNSKHTELGISDRIKLLEKLDKKVKDKYLNFLDANKKLKITADDILDSLVLGFSAKSILKNNENKLLLPKKSIKDKDGLKIQICYSLFHKNYKH